jgi:hypothetical protein
MIFVLLLEVAVELRVHLESIVVIRIHNLNRRNYNNKRAVIFCYTFVFVVLHQIFGIPYSL